MSELQNAPQFSVIIPIYNVESYLSSALKSLISQSMEKAEFILVDDGSTDGSNRIIQEMLPQDKRFVYLRQENKGYGAAMNLGLEQAAGEYIGILEPDDFYTEGCLDRAAHLIASLPENSPDIIKGNFTLFYDGDVEEKEYALRSACFNSLCNLKQNPGLIINNPSIWSAFYRRDFLNTRGIRFRETPGASFQDLPFFWETMTKAESIFVCRDVFYRYRQDNPGSSINKTLDYKRIIRIYQDLLPEIEMNAWNFAKIAEDLYWNYKRIAKENRRIFMEDAAALLSNKKMDLSKLDSRRVKWFMWRLSRV